MKKSSTFSVTGNGRQVTGALFSVCVEEHDKVETLRK